MIYLNKSKDMLDPMEKMRSLQTLNFQVRSDTQLLENVTISTGSSVNNFTGYELYLDVMSITSAAAYSKKVADGANDGIFPINLTSAELGNIDVTECDCREIRLRKKASGISYDVAVAKLTLETIDDSADTDGVTYGKVNVFDHAGTEGATFEITVSDNQTYRPVSIVRVSDGVEITGGCIVVLSANKITIELAEDIAVRVVYITY